MRKKLLVVVLLAAVLGAASAQEAIRIGFFDIGPYVAGQPGGKPPVGSAVDYWNTIVAPAMNVKVEWIGPMPILRLLNQARSGDLDAILVVARNAEREKLVLFPSAPYFKFQPGLALLKDNPLAAIKSQGDVAGLRIGYSAGAVVPDFMAKANVTWDNVSTATWIADGYTKLVNKRVDAVFNLGLDALQYEASRGFAGKFKFLALPIPPSDIYTAFAMTDKGKAFMKLYEPINAKNATEMDGLTKKYLK